MIDLTNDNIHNYVMENGLDKLMTSMSKGVHILILTKKNKLIGKCFSRIMRSDDKLSVESVDDIAFLSMINAEVNKAMLLTAGGEFSIVFIVNQNSFFFCEKSLTFNIAQVKLIKNSRVVIDKIKLVLQK